MDFLVELFIMVKTILVLILILTSFIAAPFILIRGFSDEVVIKKEKKSKKER